MTLRTAVATVMALAPNERSEAAIFRGRDGVRLAQSEIAELASSWDIEAAPNLRSPRLVPEQHWPDIVRGMVREAPLPALIVAFLVGCWSLEGSRASACRAATNHRRKATGWLVLIRL